MKRKFLLVFFVILIEFAQAQTPLKLWYKQPAGNTWENALPIGNGRLGAMIYGNVTKEIIQLNEHTVWSGSPNRNDNPQSLEKLAEIRKLIFEGNHKEAEKLANQAIITKTSHGQKFEPVGNLNLVFDGHENFTNYYRELDIDKAISKTTYQVGDVVYTREAFASLADRVIVMKISVNKAGNLSFNANISSPQKRKTIATTSTKDLTISGTTSDHETVKGMVEYKGITRIKLEGGSLQSTDTSLIVKGANSATIFISIATNFNNYQDLSGDEDKRATEYLNKAYPKTYTTLLNSHTLAYQRLFNRVKIDLGETDAVKLPTDERLRNFRNTNDPQMVALYYQFGRYLLISSSQHWWTTCQFARHLESSHQPTVGQQIYHQHQRRNELLASRENQSFGIARAFLENGTGTFGNWSENRQRYVRGKRLDGSPQYGYLASNGCD